MRMMAHAYGMHTYLHTLTHTDSLTLTHTHSRDPYHDALISLSFSLSSLHLLNKSLTYQSTHLVHLSLLVLMLPVLHGSQ
jgi:hypothetical protein